MMKQLSGGNLEKTQLGLGHSYSRAKVKFNVNRSDTMITQAICMLDQLDKDINTFAMRIRYFTCLFFIDHKSDNNNSEWYGWHFPELVKIVNENKAYALLAQFIKDKARLGDSDLEQLEVITGDPGKAKQILDASRSSMGTDISEVDMINIGVFASRVLSLVEYRQELQQYLHSKMHHVAPNLSALIGDTVGARLISHAGSLTSLAKYPASTVQILGAEKALFRALKTRGNTPKYGLIYHSSFIGRAGAKNKGRISRYLANKCTIASRIDCFTDTPTTKFGEAMKRQVEDRLNFYETGKSTTKNADVMQSVILELQGGDLADPLVAESSKKRKKADGNEKTKKSKKTKKESK
jgi:nucleolar protein 56